MQGFHLRKFKFEFAAAGAAFFILAIILLFRPITGVADNGDFARIMYSTGLFHLSEDIADRYFGFVNRLYGAGFVIPFGGGYISTQLPLVLLAVFISKSVLGTALFDIRFLAAIYILVLTVSIFFAARWGRKFAGFLGVVTALSVIFIFCDIGYISYFNSLYGEPVTFVFLLLMAGMALTLAIEEKPAVWMLILFSAGAIIFTGAKVQNSPTGLLAALLLIRLAWLRKDLVWRRISMVSAVLVLAVSLASFVSVSRDIKICNKYQTVFYGILRNSPDPAGDLEELGLDPSLSVLAGTNYFMEEYPIDIKAPEFKKMLYNKISYTGVAAFYLRHPRRFLQKLEYAAENGFRLKQGFGNFEKYPGIQYKQQSNVFGFWSNFKLDVLPNSLIFVCAFYTLVLLVLIHEYIRAGDMTAGGNGSGIARTRFFIEFMGAVTLMGIMQFVLPVVGDGDADLSKHLFLFNISFDMLFAAGLTYLSIKAAALAHIFLKFYSFFFN